MAYLITGGAGFIGSRLAAKLLADNKKVVALDNFRKNYDPKIKRENVIHLQRKFPEHFSLIEGDVRDVELVQRIFGEHEISHLAHLAPMPGVHASIERAHYYTDVNIMGTVNILEASKQSKVKQFVLASAGPVYGGMEQRPFIETDTADRPLSPFGAITRATEILAHPYYHLFGLNVTSLRIFNVYGPGGRPHSMVHRLFKAAVEGTAIQTYDIANNFREWIYIDDVVDGFIAALHQPLGYEIINLCTGKVLPLIDIIKIIEEYTGNPIKREDVAAPRSDECDHFYGSNKKAQELLAFTPQTTLREGLWEMWLWFQKENLEK